MMGSILAVGVPAETPTGGFDVWIPAYVVLSLALVRFVAGLRIRTVTALAALAFAMVWTWAVNVVGVIPAAAFAMLAAFTAGELVRRAKSRRAGEHPD